MFVLAVFIGIYSYAIFALGLLGLLTKLPVIILTILWAIAICLYEKKHIKVFFKKTYIFKKYPKQFYKNLFFWFAVLFFLQTLVNLIGALGPELGFDALWYHLTFPKLWLLQHRIEYIPGGLLYYSVMPKLGETLYVGALAFGNEITAKVIQFTFSLLVSFALYKFSRKFFTPFISILIVVIFYSNLVVDWESITAYIDLIRTFFELLALWGFINWFENKSMKWLILSALMMGLAITTKVLAAESLLVFSLLIVVSSFFNKSNKKDMLKNLFSSLVIYWFIALLIPLPWFIFSFIHTGNPVYPFFSQLYKITPTPFSFVSFFSTYWDLFMRSSDPISPLYMLLLPLLFVTFSTFKRELKLIVWYCALSLFLWYFTPQTGGGRFILPYLPAFSMVCGSIYYAILKERDVQWIYVRRLVLSTIILVAGSSIGYRFIANSKYIPVLIGRESSSQFLTTHLNFSYGDFFDTDGYFENHIKSTDTVLLYGFHNLYYVDFPFVDNSWVKKGYKFNYIAIQKSVIPAKYKNWQLIYFNDKTMVQLYKPPKGGCLSSCYY